MNTTLYFVRHCRATGQEPDAPLSEEGLEQAATLAERLSSAGIQRVISSPYVRASQTALPVAQVCGVTVETDDRLVERVLSALPRSTWQSDLAATFADPDLKFPGGETSREATARGVTFIEDLVRDQGATVLVVTHGNLMTLILRHFDPAFDFAQWQQMSSPDVYRVQFGAAGTSVKHIPPMRSAPSGNITA